jgi:mannose-6-phosphate isomerase
MLAMSGVPRHYSWGSLTAIPELLGIEPDGTPWAEVWFGDLASAPMAVRDPSGQWSHRDGGNLPYLAKVLAAGEPLSLQTHPDAVQARAGFDRENLAGIMIDAPTRIYRDASAKPEIVIAVSPFEALCGFRTVSESVDLLKNLGIDDLGERLERQGLRKTFEHLMRTRLDDTVIRRCRAVGDVSPSARWVTRLAERYPDDSAVAATLLLNYVSLDVGEAIYLAPGNVHAYLSGMGIEVMGPSDNVVRCGLTPKHVDVDEMMAVVHFEALANPRVDIIDGVYQTPEAPFRVHSAERDDASTRFAAYFGPEDTMHFDVGAMRLCIGPA